MDPDEGGGSPPRRSRRVQQLDPLPFPNATNDNNTITTASITPEDASASQYPVQQSTQLPFAHAYHQPIRSFDHSQPQDDNSTIASGIIIPPLPSSTSMTSADPPEEQFRFQPPHGTQSEPIQHRSHIIPPPVIQLATDTQDQAQHVHLQQSPDSSVLSTTQQQFVTTTQFAQLNHRVQQLQSNLETFQTTVNHQTTDMHRNISNINRQLQAHQSTIQNTELFEYIVKFKTPFFATLGDDSTKLQIVGYGMTNYFIDGHRVRRIGYYIPTLGTTLISIKQHMKYDGCFFHAEGHEVTLAYPAALIYPTIDPEFSVSIAPAKDSNAPYIFDETTAILSSKGKRRKYNVIDQAIPKYLPKSEIHKFSHTVRVKKLINKAKLPSRATKGSIGFDVSSTHSIEIAPNSTSIIHTGLAMSIPQPFYLRIASRSSFAAKGINVTSGVIDNDYRGEIKIMLHNSSSHPFQINQYDKIAQLIFEIAA